MTRSGVRWTVAAALITLAGGTLAVSAVPATAAPETVRILSVSAENVKPGEKVRVRFSVTNNGSRADKAIVVVGGGLPCTSGCRAEPKLAPGRSQTFDATVVAPAAHPGETTGLNISIGVRLAGENSYAYKMVYVHGPGASPSGGDKPAAGVSGVSGRVRDSDGKAIGGVALTIRDSAGHEYRTTSGGSGQFSITASVGRTIAEGPITVRAAMDGYRAASTTVRGTAGAVATVRLTLSAVPAPTTASSSPAVEASALDAPADGTPEAASPALKAVSDGQGSSALPFVLGGLLVAAGLGTLVLLVMRRRKATEAGVPPTTQLPASAGGSMADAPTAVLRPVGGGSMTDAPTAVLHRPVGGGFPGTYGGPAQGGTHQDGHRS
ncbi:carboxypeptidase-like regulatory domain-containing protein [Micromonospora sp. NPDC000663]|uniref:carboxypeptidase-like regulatory domain-containing protein n=1 Tax=Micromonospora sp. NPDC000663 TaxID=3364218 RepID=UPI0036BEA1C6